MSVSVQLPVCNHQALPPPVERNHHRMILDTCHIVVNVVVLVVSIRHYIVVGVLNSVCVYTVSTLIHTFTSLVLLVRTVRDYRLSRSLSDYSTTVSYRVIVIRGVTKSTSVSF